MKYIFVSFCVFVFSLGCFAQEKIEHECVPIHLNADISKVLILFSPGQPYGKEFLEIYGSDGSIAHRWEVQYGDDMTYIAYFNEAEGVYFERDWPVESDRGPGHLEFGEPNDVDQKTKIYNLDCSSPNSNRD